MEAKTTGTYKKVKICTLSQSFNNRGRDLQAPPPLALISATWAPTPHIKQHRSCELLSSCYSNVGTEFLVFPLQEKSQCSGTDLGNMASNQKNPFIFCLPAFSRLSQNVSLKIKDISADWNLQSANGYNPLKKKKIQEIPETQIAWFFFGYDFCICVAPGTEIIELSGVMLIKPILL